MMSQHVESRLQIACVRWFRLQYSSLSRLLFAVPNGGARSTTEAKIMQAEGVTPGVSDLILLMGRGGYNALCVEMKTMGRGSNQSDRQKEWQAIAESNGNKYVICRSIEGFIDEVREYMALPVSGQITISAKDIEPVQAKGVRCREEKQILKLL